MQLIKKMPGVTVRCDGKEKFWKVNGTYDNNFEPTEMSSAPTPEWLIPLQWNHAGYDLVQYKKDCKLLRVIQVTITTTYRRYKLCLNC